MLIIFPYTYPGSLSLSLSFYILLLMPILILIKWPCYLLLIDYLKVSPYLFIKLMSTNKMFSLSYSMIQMLMDVETLFSIITAPHLRIWTAKLYPLTLSLSSSPSLDYLCYGTLLQSLHLIYLQKPSAHMHPSPPYCRTFTLPHTLC